MLDTFKTEKFFCDVLQDLCITFQQDHFKTVVVVNMDVGSGNNVVEVIMLEIGQRFFQFPLVMIVDKDQCAKDIAVFGLNALFHKLFPHNIPDSF